MPAPLAGQVSIAATAKPLSATPVASVSGYTIRAYAGNAGPVYLGPASVTISNGFILSPGDTLDYEMLNANGQQRFTLNVSDYWVVGTVNDVVSWIASPA